MMTMTMTMMRIWRRFREALVSSTYGHFLAVDSSMIIVTALARLMHISNTRNVLVLFSIAITLFAQLEGIVVMNLSRALILNNTEG